MFGHKAIYAQGQFFGNIGKERLVFSNYLGDEKINIHYARKQ